MSKMRVPIVLLALAIVLSGVTPVWFSGSAAGHVPEVTNANDSGAGSLRQVIADAAPGSVITFDAALDGQVITLASPIEIATDLTIRGNGPEETIINGEDSSVLLTVSAPGVVLENLTLQNGTAFDGGSGVTITTDGELTIRNSTLRGNTATMDGGAIANNGILWVENTTFEANAALAGGAIHMVTGASATVVDSTFTGNLGMMRGGAIHSDGTLVIERTLFAENEADIGGAVNGGAGGDQLSVSHSTFRDNQASVIGGALSGRAITTFTIENSTFSGNHASQGGALALWDHAWIFQSTFFGNSAEEAGGAIYFADAGGPSFILQSTIFENMLWQTGAGGGLHRAAQPDVVVAATILANNTVEGIPQNCDGHILSGNANLDSGTSCGFDGAAQNITGMDPMLGVLQDNGGYTQTLAPAVLSPVVDVIFGADCLFADQRDLFRPLGDGCDIGAVEQIPLPVASFTISPAPTAGEPVTFTDTSATAGTFAWFWDFGDGGTSNEVSPNHTFLGPGLFQVTLEVFDAYGNNNTTSQWVEVLEPDILGTVTYVSGTEPNQMPELEASIDELLQLNLRAGQSDGLEDYELEDLGIDETTVFNITLEDVAYTPRLLLGSGKVLSWATTPNEDGTYDINVTVRPIAQQMIVDCDHFGEENGCVPGDEWPKGRRDRANESASYNFTVQLAIDALEHEFEGEPFFSAAEREILNGTVLTTDAQEFGQPEYMLDEDGDPTLSLYVAGPHRTWDDKPHMGFYEAFLPQTLLDAWGIIDLAMLSAAYGGDPTAFTVKKMEGGAQLHLPIHYSSGTVSLTAEDIPDKLTAGFTNEAKARLNESITLRDTTRGGTQPYAWNWTLPNGTSSEEQNFTFTPSEVGPLKVTLEVTDADGETDTTERTLQVFQSFQGRKQAAQAAALNFSVGQQGQVVFTSKGAATANVVVRHGNSANIFEEAEVPDLTVQQPGKRGLRFLEVETGGDHSDQGDFSNVTIRLNYTAAELAAAGLEAAQLEILYWNGTHWVSTFTDTDADGNISGTPGVKDLHVFETGRAPGTVWAVVNHTSQYALAGTLPVVNNPGGGGGGPLPSPSPSPSETPTPPPTQEPTPQESRITTARLEAILPGMPAAAPIGDGTVQEVRLVANQALTGVTVRVHDLGSDRPEAATSDAPGQVLRYLDIAVEGDDGPVAAGALAGGGVTFLATADDLAAADLTPQRVALAHWDGAAWELLPTTYLGEADGRHWFEAETPGFSPFAIVGTDDSAEVATGATAREGPTSPFMVVGLVALAALAAVGAGGFGWWHQAGRPSDMGSVQAKARADLARARAHLTAGAARLRERWETRFGGRRDQ